MATIKVTNTTASLSGKTLATTEDAQSITGLKTFSRSPNAPFAVQAASAAVANLDADKLDGQEGAYYRDADNLNAGTLSGDRLPNPLPAVSGEFLTNLPASGDASQIVFTPQRNQPPATAYATPDVRNSHPVLDFDPSTDESAIFGDVLWSDYDAEDIQVVIMWLASTATSGDVVWNAAFERIEAADLDIDADSFATAQAATGTANGTSGILTYTTITFTSAQIDALTAGEAFRLKMARDADNGSDTMAGDAEILRVVLRKV